MMMNIKSVLLYVTAMQNGGLSSYVSNPFSLLSGGRVPTTAATQGTPLKESSALNASNASTSSSRADPYGGLNKSQINALWGLSVPGAMYGRSNSSNPTSADMLTTSGSRLGMSMHSNMPMSGPYAGAYGGLMPHSGVYPR